MRLEKRIVDLNAFIKDVNQNIKENGGIKYLDFSFTNLQHGNITAIKLYVTAKDSFGDTVSFGDSNRFEVKRVDLNIKKGDNCSFSTEIGRYDIKQVNVLVDQIVFDNNNICKPLDTNVVEYEIERLSSSWTSTEHFEKDALERLQEYNSASSE